jgi:hypothetical protein
LDFELSRFRIVTRNVVDSSRSVENAAHVHDENRQEGRYGPSRNAGAAACEMTSES